MVEWIVTSSAMILLVVLLRILIKDRVSPRLRYALWGLVLLRLLVPVSLWESPVSILCAARASEGYQLASTLPTHLKLHEDGTLSSLTGPEDTFRMKPGNVSGEKAPPPQNGYGWVAVPSAEEAQALRDRGQKAVDTAGLKRLVDVQNVLLGVWQAGIGLFILFLAAVNGRFAFGLRQKRRPGGEYCGRSVYIADGLPSPCLFGLFRPAIYLTPGLGEDEKSHVLAHEYTHFRQGDHLWAALRGACLALHWYNPLVWLAAYLSRRDCELSCDEGAVRLLGEEKRADYGRTLVGLVARRTTAADLACCATTMTGGKSALKERIALLVKQPRTTAVMAVLIAAACVVFAVCTFTGAAELEEPEPEPAEPVQTEREPADEPAPEHADLPENLPTELMDLSRSPEEQGEWLLLARTPEIDIALYRSAGDDQHVYLRVTNQSFQRFDRDLSGMKLLPTLEVVEGEADITVQALYRRYEGNYFNGTSYESGIVADQIFYDWDESAKRWTEWTISTHPAQRFTEDIPALEDLPTELIDVPGASQDPIWLMAELPEDDIAVYYEAETGRSWLRYGDALQALDPGGRAITTPRLLMPELYFQDLDGDGENELAMIYNSDSGTGVSVWDLLVCEWDGQRWTEYLPDTAKAVIDDFNASRTLEVSPDTGAAGVGYLGSTVTVDMNAVYKERGQERPSGAPYSCTLDGDNYSYRMHRSGRILLQINGAVQAEGYPTYENNLLYTCAVTYHADGSFTATDEGLTAWYPYFDLTPTFQEILLDFIQERQEAVGGDISADRFAICDVNGDGKDELITQTNAAPMAGQVEVVYDGDGNVLLSEYPLVVYYSNGYATAAWSHNQGVAGDKLWPYTLLRYDEDAGKYVDVASVDGWDRSIRDTYLSYDESVILFPEDVDKNGDSFVYYVIEEEGGYAPVYGEPMDDAEFAQWAARYMEADVVHVNKQSLSEENIALIRQ